jgi:hypothetical protein
MRRPEPRDKFKSEAEELEHTLDCLCWAYAESASLDLDLPVEDCADSVKHLVLCGRVVIDFDEKRDRFRLMPAPSQATN